MGCYTAELSQRGSKYTPPIDMDMQVLGARVSTKGSNAENAVNASGEEHDANVIPTMRLYVQHDNCTRWWPWETDMMRGLPFTVSLMQMML